MGGHEDKTMCEISKSADQLSGVVSEYSFHCVGTRPIDLFNSANFSQPAPSIDSSMRLSNLQSAVQPIRLVGPEIRSGFDDERFGFRKAANGFNFANA